MILAITFLFPAVLFGASAAAAPIIIHLILRTKPRQIVFPAMRFVRKTHHATLKMLRLKHLLLLLLRMAAIALAAVLIARARLPAWSGAEDLAAPAAAAIVLDNTGSMNYRRQGESSLAAARQQARKVIDSLPKGSRVVIVPVVDDRPPAMLDPSLAVQQVADLPATCRRATVARALRQATDLVRRDERTRKAVYLLTDLTAESWRDESRLAEEKDVDYTIIKCGGEDVNVLLGDLKLSSASLPLGAEALVETTLFSVNVGGDRVVEVILDGEPVAQQTLRLQAGGAAAFAAAVRPKREGAIHGQVTLRDADPLDMDNIRYFTLHVGPPAKVLVVAGTAADDQTGFVMSHAAVPGAQGAGADGLQCQTLSVEQLDGGRLQGCRVALVAGAPALSEAQWRRLEPFVRAGGALWVVVGPLISPDSYNVPAAQQLMPAALGSMEALPKQQRWVVSDLAHPMLQPFDGEANPPLAEVACASRFRVKSLAADAKVIVQFEDHAPAILVRRVGEGTVVLWNFSPLPGQSNLARLEQLPILARRTAAVLAADPSTQTQYACGQTAMLSVPRWMPGATVTLRRPGSPAEQTILPDAKRGAVIVPTGAPGDYDVRFAEGEKKFERGFSVNAEAAESDLRPVEAARLAESFPPGLAIVSDASELAGRRAAAREPLDLTPALLLALLAVLIGESFFANRFYRPDKAAAK
jgi:hypothetical protein